MVLGVQFVHHIWFKVVGCSKHRTMSAIRTVQLPASAAGVIPRRVSAVRGHVGASVYHAVRRTSSECADTAWRTAITSALQVLAEVMQEASIADSRDAIVHALMDRGAELAKDTTPALVRTQHHNDALIWDVWEASQCFPVLTLLGNLNEVPELMNFVADAVKDATLRRRLCAFQRVTDTPPPMENEKFVWHL